MIEAILRIFNNFEKERFVVGDGEKSEKAFVTCFTTKADNRLLWTPYANDEGYCLGINFENFERYIKDSHTQAEIFKIANKYYMTGIVYSKENQKSLIKDLIRSEYDRFSHLPDNVLSENIPTLIFPYQFVFTDEENNVIYKGEKRAIQLRFKQKFEFMTKSIIEQLLFISPILKNDYWEDEGEIRLVFYRPVVSNKLPSVHIDDKKRNYINFELSPEIFDEVIIGPQNMKTLEEVQKDLVNAGYDISKIKVRYSKGKDVVRDRGI
ncbi:MAG: hypothetical protein A4E52_00391 [Pelotomaculum sp. PtaB.Bin013]|uniref:DUF2971 domain-containing protein n=1 Tax=Pelotomaculum isophthalicicum JI TaxID=947010 RepID=A0A9X4H3T9_9FIRM|nr:DUF2971 domain-containing protein [Pelotomaculum isophthalicicum]MDF9409855.1 DUF2971 domain-containing protein [Pelotomaculum isophthalicicum JI]OPX91715.1 MAG: hypothetical protein A4E52_00391 [Pelotomaculum sp. PtaB.Bin013]